MNEHRARPSKARGCATSAGIGIMLVLLFLWIMPNCTLASAKAKKARALSPEQLQGLHQAMTKLRASYSEEDLNRWIRLQDEKIPPEFALLGARSVTLSGRFQAIRLEVCMDHSLNMMVYGAGEKVEPGKPKPVPRIVLQAGEHEITEEELWRQDRPVLPK